MSKRSKDTPPSVRVRDNQRRSRARHKAYVETLQQRLQECESQRVTATVEMQQAARKVARDNARLRSLLARHGVSNEDVDSYLLLSEEKLHSVNPAVAITATTGLERSESATAIPVSGMAQSPRRQVIDTPPAQSLSEYSIAAGQVEEVPYLDDERGNSNDCCQDPQFGGAAENTEMAATAEELGLPSTISAGHCHSSRVTASENKSSSSPLETPCDAAARILTAMRGYNDESSVRAALGCRGLDDCSVPNVVLFEIMDEA